MTSLGILGLIAYHAHLFNKVRHSPLEASIGITKRMRRDWVQVVMENNHDILDFFFAFFNFALSIRYYNHASFAINVPPSRAPLITYDTVSGIINHGHIHYTLSMRGLLSGSALNPLAFWACLDAGGFYRTNCDLV